MEELRLWYLRIWIENCSIGEWKYLRSIFDVETPFMFQENAALSSRVACKHTSNTILFLCSFALGL